MRGRGDDGEKRVALGVALINKQVKLLAEKDRKGHAITWRMKWQSNSWGNAHVENDRSGDVQLQQRSINLKEGVQSHAGLDSGEECTITQ
jgi:hypothetical protein